MREKSIHQGFLRAPYTIVTQPWNSSQRPSFGINVASETAYHSVLTGTEMAAAGLVFWAETSTRPSWMRAMMRQMGELKPKVYAISMEL